MTISYAGTLPVSLIQAGLATTAPGLSARVSDLTAEIDKLAASLAAQVQVTATFPPNLPLVSAAVVAAMDPSALAWLTNPAQLAVGCAALNVELAIDFAKVEAQLAIVTAIVGPLAAGVSAGGLGAGGWRGPAAGFGLALDKGFRRSGGGLPRFGEANGLVMMCEDEASWGSFSKGFRTGSGEPGIEPLGVMTAGELVVGLELPLTELELYLRLLAGRRTALLAVMDIALGLSLPPFPFPSIDLGLALESLVGISLDLGAEIQLVLGRIDAVLELSGAVSLALQGQGIHLWRYSGVVADLGAELAAATQSGLPGGGGALAETWGVAIECVDPVAWAAFGNLVPI